MIFLQSIVPAVIMLELDGMEKSEKRVPEEIDGTWKHRDRQSTPCR